MKTMINIKTINTPVGVISLFAEEDKIIVLEWGKVPETEDESPVLSEAVNQLNAYFDGKLQNFDLPVAPNGTQFQKNVWAEMQKIPYGQVKTYGDISGTLKSAPRAIGGACGKNPIPIIIPCHRIIGTSGKMTGFSGGEGVETKIQLLTLEGYYL